MCFNLGSSRTQRYIINLEKHFQLTKRDTYFIITMDCAKNLVASASLSSVWEIGSFNAVEQLTQAEFIVVNTCGFIQSAREETLQKSAKHKSRNSI